MTLPKTEKKKELRNETGKKNTEKLDIRTTIYTRIFVNYNTVLCRNRKSKIAGN